MEQFGRFASIVNRNQKVPKLLRFTIRMKKYIQNWIKSIINPSEDKMNGEYKEKLPFGKGELVVTKKNYLIQFYFPGPDL